MRRGLAGLILGLSLVVASVSWAGFVMTRTVLDPSRSERLADQLLDNETLRAALVGRLSDALGATLPADVPVPRQQLEQAADAALEDERVDALIRDGIVRMHRNALEGNNEPITIDATALGSASRDSLVAVRPELDALLPNAPPVEIELPTGGLSWLGALRRTVARFTLLLALGAAAGALVSLLVTNNRPAILRRVSMWAFGAAAFWMVVGFGIPFLARTLAPSSNAIIAAIIDVFFGAMIPPAIAMAVFGAALLGASMLWSSMAARRPATQLQPRGRTKSPQPKVSVAANAANGAFERGPTAGGQRSNIRHAAPSSASVGPSTQVPRADATVIMPVVPPTSAAPAGPAAARSTRPTQWVEGVGYVEGESVEDEPDDFNRPT